MFILPFIKKPTHHGLRRYSNDTTRVAEQIGRRFLLTQKLEGIDRILGHRFCQKFGLQDRNGRPSLGDDRHHDDHHRQQEYGSRWHY